MTKKNLKLIQDCIKKLDSLFEILSYLKTSHERKKEEQVWDLVQQYRRNYIVDLKPKVVDVIDRYK